MIGIAESHYCVRGKAVARPLARRRTGNSRGENALLHQLLDRSSVETEDTCRLRQTQLWNQGELLALIHRDTTKNSWPRKGLVVPPDRKRNNELALAAPVGLSLLSILSSSVAMPATLRDSPP
jgi:hypothetical protein